MRFQYVWYRRGSCTCNRIKPIIVLVAVVLIACNMPASASVGYSLTNILSDTTTVNNLNDPQSTTGFVEYTSATPLLLDLNTTKRELPLFLDLNTTKRDLLESKKTVKNTHESAHKQNMQHSTVEDSKTTGQIISDSALQENEIKHQDKLTSGPQSSKVLNNDKSNLSLPLHDVFKGSKEENNDILGDLRNIPTSPEFASSNIELLDTPLNFDHQGTDGASLSLEQRIRNSVKDEIQVEQNFGSAIIDALEDIPEPEVRQTLREDLMAIEQPFGVETFSNDMFNDDPEDGSGSDDHIVKPTIATLADISEVSTEKDSNTDENIKENQHLLELDGKFDGADLANSKPKIREAKIMAVEDQPKTFPDFEPIINNEVQGDRIFDETKERIRNLTAHTEVTVTQKLTTDDLGKFNVQPNTSRSSESVEYDSESNERSELRSSNEQKIAQEFFQSNTSMQTNLSSEEEEELSNNSEQEIKLENVAEVVEPYLTTAGSTLKAKNAPQTHSEQVSKYESELDNRTETSKVISASELELNSVQSATVATEGKVHKDFPSTNNATGVASVEENEIPYEKSEGKAASLIPVTVANGHFIEKNVHKKLMKPYFVVKNITKSPESVLDSVTATDNKHMVIKKSEIIDDNNSLELPDNTVEVAVTPVTMPTLSHLININEENNLQKDTTHEIPIATTVPVFASTTTEPLALDISHDNELSKIEVNAIPTTISPNSFSTITWQNLTESNATIEQSEVLQGLLPKYTAVDNDHQQEKSVEYSNKITTEGETESTKQRTDFVSSDINAISNELIPLISDRESYKSEMTTDGATSSYTVTASTTKDSRFTEETLTLSDEALLPKAAGRTFHENVAAEAGIGNPLPSHSNSNNESTLSNRAITVVVLCSTTALVFIAFLIVIFLITFHRQHGTLDIEMQEQRCGKDDLDEEDAETRTKLLNPPPQLDSDE